MKRPATRSYPRARWVVFLLALAIAIAWAAKSIAAGAHQMKVADAQVSEFAAFQAGDHAKVVVQIEKVDGSAITGILLERKTDTDYRKPAIEPRLRIDALLSQNTSVVMGKPSDLAPGATVQIDGVLNGKRALLATQVAILTGYVTVSEVTR